MTSRAGEEMARQKEVSRNASRILSGMDRGREVFKDSWV